MRVIRFTVAAEKGLGSDPLFGLLEPDLFGECTACSSSISDDDETFL